MNRSVTFLLSVFSVIMALSIVAPASAMDYIIGAKGGYYVWKPFIRDIPGNEFSTLESGTGALAGPILGISFTNDITLSLSGLFGQQTAQWNVNNAYRAEDNDYQSLTCYMQEQRYDIDTALSYQVIQGLRVFIGYKYQYLEVDYIKTRRTAENATMMGLEEDKMVFEIPLHGVAFGGSYAAPITDLYFFSVSLSGIVMRGKFKVTEYEMEYNTGTSTAIAGTSGSGSQSFDMQQMGFNFEPAIGIRTGGPIITLGMRYQYLRSQFYNQEATSNDGPSDNWMNDHLYGVFMSVMFVL
ncbi:MAG TPA: hypothetical protein PLI62_01735 [Spirochaetota bacterium]|nr:hypothetical protein [Spirochaetota bacterium]